MSVLEAGRSWHVDLERLPSLVNIGRFSLLLSVLLIHVFTQVVYEDNFGLGVAIFNNKEFYIWSMLYGVIIIVTLIYPHRPNHNRKMPNIHALLDVSMMVWLTYISGGVDSGFGILVLPFVATSCLLSYGRFPWLYAGYAAILLILSRYFMSSSDILLGNTRLWINTVTLSVSGFLVAYLTSFLARYFALSRRAYASQTELLNRFRNLTDMALNHVQEAVIAIDEKAVVRLLNRQAQVLFPNLQLNQETTIFSVVDSRWKRDLMHEFILNEHVDGNAVRVRAHPLVEGEIPLLLLFARSQKDLSQEAMTAKLAALGQLTANLAHEIRNPMSAIRQANGLLCEDEEDSVRVRLHEMIDNNISRIDKMLEDVRAIRKVGTAKRSSVDLMQMWRTFKQEFLLTKPEAAGCLNLVVGSGRYVVLCDALHLQQIFWNLFNNAWRHSKQDKDAITLTLRRVGNAEVSILVADNGSGISEANQAHLFEPFFTTESGGTGLGLYVARELAQSNLGRLGYVASENGFELILPGGGGELSMDEEGAHE